MNNRFIGVGLVGLLAFFLGCRELQGQTRRSAKVKSVEVDCLNVPLMKAHLVFLILIDRSGSFMDGSSSRIDRIRNESAQAVRQLPSGTVIVGRYVAERSYDAQEQFLFDAIPNEPVLDDCPNIFSAECRKAKVRYQVQMACLDKARERIADTLQRLDPPRASKTDVWGAMAAASEIFSAYPMSRRAITLFSDTDDNVKTSLPKTLPGIQGVEVVVRTAGVKSPQRMAQLTKVFNQSLSGWGADKVHFIPLGIATTLAQRNGLFN